MNKQIIKRVEQEANYIIKTKETIRDIAKKFGISKSTFHKDMQERLKEIDFDKYKIVQSIFQEHIETRHILGGQSTKIRYLQLKQNSEG